MKRRDVLKGTVLAGTAGFLLDACAPGTEQLIPILIPEEPFIPGVEEWVCSTCFACPGGCGLRVRKIDGRLVKIEGNPLHPVSRGGSCARAQALPQALYHPDRLRTPLVRAGDRGEGRWKEISWEEALDRLASELALIQEKGSTETLTFLTGTLRAHRLQIVHRFLAAFGSRHHWVHEPFGDGAVRRAHSLSAGVESFFAYDLESTDYLVSFGAALIEASRSPVRLARGIAHMRQGRPGRRAKVVAVEPRLSLTAATADEWLPARPGTEAWVALGLAHVLLREGLYENAFAEERTRGFGDFRELVLARYAPERAAEAADVTAETLERLAREMAAHRPALVVAGDAAVSGSNGLATALAVSHLNALLGGYGRNGGIFRDPEPPFAPWPALPAGGAGQRPVEIQSLAASLSRIQAGDVQVLLISGTNPVYSLPSSFAFSDALARIPFIASFASFLDETSDMADMILPEPTSFERFDDDVPSPGTGVALASLSAPLLARPLYDTRSMPDVLLQVASRSEGAMAQAFRWTSYEEALRAAWAGLHQAGRGSIVESSESSFWEKALEQGGWWDENVSPDAEPLAQARQYQFEIGPLEAGALQAQSASEEFPLFLHVYPSAAFGGGRSAHLPFLQELSDPMTGVRWGTVVELNPETARHFGVREGQPVEVISSHGRLRAPARLSPGLRPNVIAVAAGQGHTRYGRYGSGKGANVFELLAPSPEPDSEAASLTATLVTINAL